LHNLTADVLIANVAAPVRREQRIPRQTAVASWLRPLCFPVGASERLAVVAPADAFVAERSRDESPR
jgi:hypothetical protein